MGRMPQNNTAVNRTGIQLDNEMTTCVPTSCIRDGLSLVCEVGVLGRQICGALSC